MRTRSTAILVLLAFSLTTVLLALSGRGVRAATAVETHLFPLVGVTNAQVVRLTYVNTSTEPATVSMDFMGGKVNGATWTASALASQKNVVVAPGQAAVLALDWAAAGGLAAGERAQVFGRLQVTGIQSPRDIVASMEVTDLLGALIPQVLGPQFDELAEPRPDPITVGFHTIAAIVTNRHAVRVSYVNRYAAPVRVNLSIIGGKMTGAAWSADTLLAGQKDLLLGPGQGTVLNLNWNAIGGLAGNERAQIYGRLSVNGIISPRDAAVGSLQVTDLLGILPGHTRLIEKDGTI